MLDTVAAVPGMVGATITHLTCLRRVVNDDGWIRTLMEEAVLSYTLYLDELDSGRLPNPPTPAIAQHYRELADDLQQVAAHSSRP